MKKIYFLFTVGILITGSAYSQWCTPTASPTTMNSYGSSSPVITNVTFNTINRTSLASVKELYINTGEGTTVSQGSTVPFSLTQTIDPGICSQMHIRVWIDWNLDGDFIDAGELALSQSNWTATSFNGPINVPATATLGTTRMRVAIKMVENCGHTTPDPCVPTESVGWHGEIEDYNLIVTTSTGINHLNSSVGFGVYPNPSNGVFNLNVPSDFNATQVSIYAITGAEVYNTNVFQSELDLRGLEKGIYFIKVKNNSTTLIERLIIK